MPVTDTYQTKSELEILFQTMIIDILDLAVGSPADYDAAAYFVRVAWPTSGAPAWKVTENICFLRVTEEDDQRINIEREVKLTLSENDPLMLNEETSRSRVIALNLIFYGPNSWENAETVKDSIYSGSLDFRFDLSKEKIYPLPTIPAARRIPEPFQSQYWERVDLEIRFNENIKKNRDIATIGEVPMFVKHVNVRSETESREFTIEET